jgi:hypothetical protein
MAMAMQLFHGENDIIKIDVTAILKGGENV